MASKKTQEQQVIKEELENNVVRISAEKFELEEQEGDGGKIVKGYALPYDQESRNGFAYIKESIVEAAKGYPGRPFLFNHDEDTVIGHVEQFELKEDGANYRSNVNPNATNQKTGVTFAESFERGDISHVSIKCSYDPEKSYLDEDTGIFHAYVDEFYELSAVTIPGFADTTAQVVESFKENQKPAAAGNTAPEEATMSKEAEAKEQDQTPAPESEAQEQDDEEPMDPMEQFQEEIDSLKAKLQDHEARLAQLEEPKESDDEEEPESDDAEEGDTDTDDDNDEEESVEEQLQKNRKVPKAQESTVKTDADVSQDDLKHAFMTAL